MDSNGNIHIQQAQLVPHQSRDHDLPLQSFGGSMENPCTAGELIEYIMSYVDLSLFRGRCDSDPSASIAPLSTTRGSDKLALISDEDHVILVSGAPLSKFMSLVPLFTSVCFFRFYTLNPPCRAIIRISVFHQICDHELQTNSANCRALCLCLSIDPCRPHGRRHDASEKRKLTPWSEYPSNQHTEQHELRFSCFRSGRREQSHQRHGDRRYEASIRALERGYK